VSRIARTASQVLLLLLTGTCAMSAELDAARFREQVQRSAARVVKPVVIARHADVVLRPDVTVATENPATPSVAAPPIPDAGAVAVEPDRAIVAPSLKRGELLFVNLSADAEQVARKLLQKQIASIAPANAATVQTISGVARQLSSTGEEVQIKPFALVGRALHYVHAERRFTGSVAVGATDISGSQGTKDLSVPVLFEELGSEQRVTLSRTSPPFERFIVSTAAAGEPVTLSIASSVSQEGMSITVPVEPTLLIDVDNTELRGMGLQLARLTVRAVGGTAAPEGKSVSVSAPGAFLTNDEVKFDANGVARAELRTDRTGQILVSATSTGYVAGVLDPIEVRWPWQTFVWSLGGGVLGGFLRQGPKIRSGAKGARIALSLVLAAATGTLVFVLYVLGVKLLPVTFGVQTGDLFAFAASALGGWLGSGILPSVAAPKRA
jgi:hypothetical protein